MITDSAGERLVRLAREAVNRYLSESVVMRPPGEAKSRRGKEEKEGVEKEAERAGVFVTLSYLARDRAEHLRGCVGFPVADGSRRFSQSVIEAAIAAATQDPRFPPVDRKELGDIVFEVSVLTPPQELGGSRPEDYRAQIKVGRDGLILRWRHGSGLLLPQVPVELGWDVDEYLANICYKAGAPADAWLDPSSKLYRFEAAVFKEREPGGRVERLNL